jgi:hypothetical protein
MSDQTQFDWIAQAKANGWDGPLHLLLDTLEPFGALGAQMIWVLQPTLGFFFASGTLRELAHALEQPDGIAELRRQLAATPTDTDKPPST